MKNDVQRQNYPEQVLDDLRNPTFVSFIDAARWISAAIVFLGHLRNPLFYGFDGTAAGDRTLLVNAWFFVTGFHAEAVVVFFVVSGYLVGGSAAARSHLGTFRPPDYALDRCTRILLPYLPALLLTAGLDWIGMHYLGDVGLYTNDQAMIRQKIASGAFSATYYPDIFLMNLLMQQTIRVEPFGSNQPLWTISLEFWFYIVFGVALIAREARKRFAMFGWLATLGVLMFLLGETFLIYIGLWLVGLAVAYVSWRKVERPFVALICFFAILILVRAGLTSAKLDETIRTGKNYVIAIAFGWLLLSMRTARFRPLLMLAPLNAFMAKYSYSVYLIHFPLMIFLLSALFATGHFAGIATGYAPTDPIGLGVYALVAAIVYAMAWGFAQGTENQTGRLRRWIKTVLIGVSRAPGRAL